MIKKYIKILFLLFISTSVFAQTNHLDSLKNVINTTNSDTAKVNTLNIFAQQMIRYNLSSSIDTIELSISIAKKTGYDLGLAKALKIKAILFFYTGKTDSSLVFLDQSLNIYLKLNDKLNAGKVYNNIGILLKTQGEIEAAIDTYLVAIDLFIQVNEKRDLVSAYINLSTAYRYQGNYQRALSVNYDALSILDNLNNKSYSDSLKVGHIYKTIANIYTVQKKQGQADSNYNKALEIYQTLNSSQDIADIYVNFAINAENEKNYTRIINYNRRALKLYTSVSKIALADINISNAYIDLLNYDSAKFFVDKALQIYTDLNDSRGLALVNYSYGRFYFSKQQLDSTIIHLNYSLDYSLSSNDYELTSKITKTLYKAYKATGDYQKALEVHETYKSAEDSIFNKSNEQQLTQMSLTYEFEKEKEQTQLAHQEEIKRQKLVRNFSLLTLIISLFGILSLFWAFLTKKKKNKELSEKNAEILQQQEEIITQNEEIEIQNKEIEIQRDLAVKRGNELQQKNNDIEASIYYAQRIQQAILPEIKILQNYFSDSFVYYIPRDIVSGDFYWFFPNKEKIYIVAADCTGHGVPGAFMSMLGISFFNQIASENAQISANEMLNKIRDMVIKSLKQDAQNFEGSHDGMDLSLIIFNKSTLELDFSGAYNPVYIVSENEPENFKNTKSRVSEISDVKKKIFELRADRMPIGVFVTEIKKFNTSSVKISKGDRIFMFSDGYPDMFDRTTNNKFTTKRLKKLLLNSADKDLKVQHKLIDYKYQEWTMSDKQIDDIIVIGLEV